MTNDIKILSGAELDAAYGPGTSDAYLAQIAEADMRFLDNSYNLEAVPVYTSYGIVQANMPGSNLQSMICEAYFKTHPVTGETLSIPEKARAVVSDIQSQIVTAVRAYNQANRVKEKGREELKMQVPKGPIIDLPYYAMRAAKMVKLIEGSQFFVIDETPCVMREYDRHGIPTGMWLWINCSVKDEDSVLYPIIRNLFGSVTAGQVRDAMLSIRHNLLQEHILRGDGMVTTNNPSVYNFTLVPCDNGVFDLDAQKFTPWRQAEETYPKMVFTSKLTVKWPETTPTCPAYFDPVAFIYSLFDGDAVGQAQARIMLQIYQFILRKYKGTHGYTIFWVNSNGNATGKNGKSTAQDLIGYTVSRTGPGRTFIKKPIEEVANRFGLGQYARDAYVILGDETAGNIGGLSKIKNMSRGDQGITVDRKGKSEGVFSFSGCVIQCQNQMPVFVSDRGGHIDSAQLKNIMAIKFEKNFDPRDPNRDPIASTLIKDVYVKDPAVHSYLVWYLCTQMPCAKDYNPADVDMLDDATAELQNANFSAFPFFDECLNGLHMNRYPLDLMLFDLYLNWCDRNNRKNTLTSKVFYLQAAEYAALHSDEFTSRISSLSKDNHKGQQRIGTKEIEVMFSLPQPFIDTYRTNKAGKPITFISDILATLPFNDAGTNLYQFPIQCVGYSREWFSKRYTYNYIERVRSDYGVTAEEMAERTMENSRDWIRGMANI